MIETLAGLTFFECRRRFHVAKYDFEFDLN